MTRASELALTFAETRTPTVSLSAQTQIPEPPLPAHAAFPPSGQMTVLGLAGQAGMCQPVASGGKGSLLNARVTSI
jgi:hypothetical protein